MSKTNALGLACRVYFSRFFEGVLCVLFQLVLRLMVAAPLLALVTTEVPWLALLSIPLYILIIPVARQNMACAMQDALSGGPLFSLRLADMTGYGRRLARGLVRGLLMLLWALPFLAATVVILWAYSGQMDAFTLMRVVMNIGGGSFMNGVKVVLVIYAATLLPMLVGCAFHSGARHAAALGDKHLVRGHRAGVMLTWLGGCLALVPFLAVLGYESADFVAGLVSALSNLGSGSFALPALDGKIYVIAAAFVVLFLPGLAFKQLLTAAYVRRLKA